MKINRSEFLSNKKTVLWFSFLIFIALVLFLICSFEVISFNYLLVYFSALPTYIIFIFNDEGFYRQKKFFNDHKIKLIILCVISLFSCVFFHYPLLSWPFVFISLEFFLLFFYGM